MLIGNVDLKRRPFIIAEIGNNHEGDPARAVELVEAAVEAGADAVKAQIIDPTRLVNRSQADRIAQLTRFRLKPEVFEDMARRVRAHGRVFFASVFDCSTLRDVLPLLDAVKIASGDLDFDPMLEIAAASGKPVILSTGMATMPEIVHAKEVVAAALPAGASIEGNLAVLHCVSLYPTPLESANLAAIPRLSRSLGLTVGYSDHTLGLEAALVALALGSRIIEKHFTLNKRQSDFRDHALSAEPDEFAELSRVARIFDAMLGNGAREDAQADSVSRPIIRRSIVAARALPFGAVLSSDDLDFVRPADGLSPTEARRLIGRRLSTPIALHERITDAVLE